MTEQVLNGNYDRLESVGECSRVSDPSEWQASHRAVDHRFEDVEALLITANESALIEIGHEHPVLTPGSLRGLAESGRNHPRFALPARTAEQRNGSGR